LRGCTEKMFDDVADWLYALRYVRHLCGEFGTDTHPLAQTLRARAAYSSLPGSPTVAELALGAMADESRPREAFQRCHRWRWQSVVRGALPHEFQAVEAIGILQEKNGEIEAAIESYVRAGSAKKVKAAAGKLPDDHPVHIDRSLLTALSPMRAAALAAAAAAADVLDDDEARAWTKVAIDEITQGDTGIPLTRGASALRAFDVVASMCQVLRDDQADSLLELLNPIIDSPAQFGWETWGPTAEILLALSSRPAAPPMLARAIVADQRMADVIVDRPSVLREHSDLLLDKLAPFARDNRYACLAIIRSGAEPAVAVELARAEVERVLAPRMHGPHEYPMYMGASDDAILASVLDQETRNRFATTMLSRALDQQEPKQNRRNDLDGLLAIAPTLDQRAQQELLAGVMELARGQHIGQQLFPFDLDLGLAGRALQCAAALNPDRATCLEIEQIGLTYLRAADEVKQWQIAQALVLLPSENSGLDLEYCAVHPWVPVRALAAVRWAKNPDVLPLERARELATDPDYEVRRDFARALQSDGTPSTDETREIIAILRQDIRRSVRTPALQAAL
jgi:hypothetical protein